jgi:hypothetical protein
VERESLPDDLEVTAQCGDGDIMGLRQQDHLTERRSVPPGVHSHNTGKEPAEEFSEYTYEKSRGPADRESISGLMDGKDLESSMPRRS